MDLQINNMQGRIAQSSMLARADKNPFIESNTRSVELIHLKNDCIIPVFSKDMECTIAHHQFIEATNLAANTSFPKLEIQEPNIRASHIIKGRVPTAIGKPVKDLLDEEKTLYYERMMFKIDIPSIKDNVNGNELNLSLGGVRAYNQENLYSKKGYEKFKVFIGFKNLACTNLCVSSDGFVEELRASSIDELKVKVLELLENFNIERQLDILKGMTEYFLTEKEFAKFLGKCRMYNYLTRKEKDSIPNLLLTDGQIGAVTKGYYEDESFSRNIDGTVSLWHLYNLLTGSNKSSYIDSFLSRSVNAHDLVYSLVNSLKNQTYNWFLDN
ncbi:DUF3871 family protein [Winogradskyella sp. SYSU M77433]|uniref:DUF3871 family protein n=1 Tax=Winogradskyella sp. SYSU M77433 TaxID=3042722 RepID=UPI0024805D49|nr:DUF3871 family protein [Winogradskyella sp. SYSU M77433]MDH7912083.1 DUF3871 family protein [Winogradskyella sp. SYSU M77433]